MAQVKVADIAKKVEEIEEKIEVVMTKSLELTQDQQETLNGVSNIKQEGFVEVPQGLPIESELGYRAKIAQKRMKVAKEVKRIKKNGYNSHNNYHYVQESDLVDEMREILFDNNLSVTIDVFDQHYREDRQLTRIGCLVTLTDAETGFYEKSRWWGDGKDNLDKAYYKAYTGILKFYLMKTFLVPSGDDPEADLQDAVPGQSVDTVKTKMTEAQKNVLNNKIVELSSYSGGTKDAIIGKLFKDHGLGIDDEDKISIDMAQKMIDTVNGWIGKKKEQLRKKQK